MISIRNARRAGVPLVVVETADPAQSIFTILKDLNGKSAVPPVLQWDIVRALVGLNSAGQEAADKLSGGVGPAATQNPTECLSLLVKVPQKSVVFFHNAHRFWDNETVVQAVWNLRDPFKASGATLVLFAPLASQLPAEIKGDCVVLTDNLPNLDEIKVIVDSTIADARAGGMEGEVSETGRIYDTLLGLSAFAAEQVLALSISKEGVDKETLWERKRRLIEQTPGLSVWRGGETFADVGGYENVKKFMAGIGRGNGAPKAILYIDEIDKAFAAVGSDSSGTTQDQHRVLLTWMQDSPNVSGVMFVGPPGSGKSAIAKATGNEIGIPTIAADLGAAKGSLVGQSEQRIRAILQVVDAVAQGNVLVIATCNSIGILPPELRRRFSLGTFFFPLPTAADREAIWKLYTTKLKLPASDTPDDEGWTGAEIRACCLIAWRLGVSLTEAAKFIVPISVSAGEQIDRLCREAHRRYISASDEGMYVYEKLSGQPQPTTVGRKIEV